MAESPQRRGTIITFYSYKGGTGRTMALANVAWLLASNGHRVLVVDWDLESPGLHRYFHPFLIDKELRDSDGVIDMLRRYASTVTRPAESPAALSDEEIGALAMVQRFAVSLEYPFPGDGGIDLVPAGRQNPEYSTSVSTFDWDDFYTRLGGTVFLDALRADLRRHYDYVLLDSRTGLSDNGGICTVALPDVLVNCFTMNNQSILGAEAVARFVLRQREEPLKIFPVPTRIEDGEQQKLDRSRTYARQRFESLVQALGREDADAYWGSVEIPYKAYYAYEEILAVFGDRPKHAGTLLAAYERLAGTITGEACALPTTVPEATRQRWLVEFERHLPTSALKLVISYAARDRMWAEWISAGLAKAGQDSDLCEVREPIGPIEQADRVLVLVSQEYLRIRESGRVWRRGETRDYLGPGRFLVAVRLDTAVPPAPFGDRDVVDLNGMAADRARETLLAALGVPDAVDATAERQAWPRFPATLPEVWKVPARYPGFTGRDALLAALRDTVFSHATARPVALTGMGGVGKTQIALEYAHRFAAFYDIVWWISADQPQIVRTELARLAAPMRLAGSTINEQVEAVLQALRQGSRFPRWLMIFDNPDDSKDLREYMPDGPGDVIITTRNPAWQQMADTIEVRVFERAESVELISRRVEKLAPADADAVAEALGDLPLVVEQAAAWLATTAMPARDYLTLLDTRLAEMLAEQPSSGYPTSAAATWSLALDRLRQGRPAAARLMELFSCLSPEPIPTWLVSTPAMVEELVKLDRGMRDPLLHNSLIRDIGRYALGRVDPSINAIRVHRLVQTVVREGLSDEQRTGSRMRMQEILAAAIAAREGGPDDEGNWSTFEDARPHLEPSGALESRDDAVRQLVLDMVRYLRQRGDYAGSQELAERALKSWARIFETEDALALLMRVYLANTLRSAGRDWESLRISEEVVPALTDLVGTDHPYTLMALGGLTADMWSFGRYQDARPLNHQLWEKWRAEIDPDHLRTLMAGNNAGIAEALCGDFGAAARIHADIRSASLRVLGPRHPWTLACSSNHARALRDRGAFDEARKQLTEMFSDFQSVLGEAHKETLRAAKSLAVTLRRLGRFGEAADLVEPTLRRSELALGTHHPETAMCALEFACVQSALGQHDLAIAQARDVYGRFRDTYGEDNPHTLAAANDLGIFLIRKGEAARAREILTDTADRFVETQGQEHPHAVICQLNLANAMHATGDFTDARRLDERGLGRLLEIFGGEHPDEHPMAIAAMANLAVSLRDTAAAHDAATQSRRALELSRRILGDEHPTTASIQDGKRIDIDIEPYPT